MPSGGLHLFLGPDRVRKLQRLQTIERSLAVQPMDRHHVDAASVSTSELLALCRQQAAEGAVRLIVVDQAHRADKACVEALLHHAASIAQTACVILLVETELAARHPLSQEHRAISIERFPERESPAVKPFALTDALGLRDVAGALIALQDQQRAGKEPLELLGLVAWQLNRWVMVKRLTEAGYNTERLSSVLKAKPWQIERIQSEVARRSLSGLQQLLERCWRLDVDAKSGRAIPQLAVEQLIIEACVAGSKDQPRESLQAPSHKFQAAN